jgi:hypothetical protein
VCERGGGKLCVVAIIEPKLAKGGGPIGDWAVKVEENPARSNGFR